MKPARCLLSTTLLAMALLACSSGDSGAGGGSDSTPDPGFGGVNADGSSDVAPLLDAAAPTDGADSAESQPQDVTVAEEVVATPAPDVVAVADTPTSPPDSGEVDVPHDAGGGSGDTDTPQDTGPDDPGWSPPAGPGVYPFGQCEPGDPPARFVAEGSPPDTLAPGQSAAVWVAFANCGDSTWTAKPAVGSSGHKLGSQAPQDNTQWGFQRVALPDDVAPGKVVRVDFGISAPTNPGSYGYQWKIVDEGVKWLEASSPHHTVAVESAAGEVATLADLWAGAAQFVVDQDPVPVNGPSSGHREAYAVNRTDVSPTTVYLYHRCFDQSAADASICLSISHDGGDSYAEFLGEIVGPDPGHIFSVAPAVIKKGNEWLMVYEESHVAALYWASSADGLSWSKKGQLLNKKGGAWDGGALATPGAVVDASGTIYVFYAGFPVAGTSMSIGFASGSSMGNLKKYAGNPVMTPPSSGWSKGQLSMPRVVEQGGIYYMIHEGADTDYTCQGTNKYGWGMAKSSNLLTWTSLPQNPLGQAKSGCGNDMPSLFIRYDGHVFAFHTSADTKRIVREHLVMK